MKKKCLILTAAAALFAANILSGKAVTVPGKDEAQIFQPLVGMETLLSPHQNIAGNRGSAASEAAEDNSWPLILVNRQNPIPADYEVTLTELDNGHAVDSRIYPYLQEMFDAARADGIYPAISSSYRTHEAQQAEMDEKINEYRSQGYSDEESRRMALEWVALPGTSEHELGLAVDITTADWEQQGAQIVWQWLNDNSYRFGFIQRYPENKTDITGIAHEAWHYRYVGCEAAEKIYESGLCLEEYLAA
ncbi:MAG: M15 family metallopeptidase [Eubacteriales bacterium]|nr:M15 family metallopeptidase [Eubacteriales bacterium]